MASAPDRVCRAQQPPISRVGFDDPKIVTDDQHWIGRRIDQVLKVGALAFDPLDQTGRAFGHLVEVDRERGELVVSGHRRANGEVTRTQRFHGCNQLRDWSQD
jgi:hypothetical protein